MAKKPPKLGGELPPYKTMGRPDKPKITQKSFQKSMSTLRTGTPIREGSPVNRTRGTRGSSYMLGGTTVKDGELLMRGAPKRNLMAMPRKRPLGPTR